MPLVTWLVTLYPRAWRQRYEEEMLGHASISITLDLYSHVLPDMQHDATSAMTAILGDKAH